jgi:hypothetical protein
MLSRMNIRPPAALAGLFFVAVSSTAQTTHYSVLCNVVGSDATRDKAPIHVEVTGRKVTGFRSEFTDHPRRIIIVNDTSGSMEQRGATQLSTELIRGFAKSASDDDRIGLVDFSDKPSLDIELSDPKTFIESFDKPEMVKKRRTRGPTELFDAILFASSHLKPLNEGDAIVLVSDGFENSNHAKVKQFVNAIRSANIRVYMLVFVPGPTIDEHMGGQYRQILYQVVDETGGMVLGAFSKNINRESFYFHFDPEYDVSGPALEAVRKQAALLHTYIEKTNRFTFDLDAPIKEPTKIKFTAPGNEKTTGLFCPRYLPPN